MVESRSQRAYRERHRDRINAERRARRTGEEFNASRRATRNVRGEKLRRKYGITLAEYEQMLVQQGGLCAICGREESRTRDGKVRHLCVDHDHDTGAVRGLLCAACNSVLGYARDKTEVLEAAMEYLNDHGKVSA